MRKLCEQASVCRDEVEREQKVFFLSRDAVQSILPHLKASERTMDQLLGNDPDKHDSELREIVRQYRALRTAAGILPAEQLLRNHLIKVGAGTLYQMRGKFRDELRVKIATALRSAMPQTKDSAEPQRPAISAAQQAYSPPSTAPAPHITNHGYVIQPGVPIPPPKRESRSWPFEAMKIGDSVLFLKNERSAAEAAASKMTKDYGVKFVFRKVDDAHARCWRIT